jgi:hypothetical protein
MVSHALRSPCESPERPAVWLLALLRRVSRSVALIGGILAACLMPFGSAGCREPQPSERAGEFQKLTATELFNLRSKCADLADRIRDGKIEPGARLKVTSRYDRGSNRCYADLFIFRLDGPVDRYLFDAQTREALAETHTLEKRKWGEVALSILHGRPESELTAYEMHSFDYANERINALIREDRGK